MEQTDYTVLHFTKHGWTSLFPRGREGFFREDAMTLVRDRIILGIKELNRSIDSRSSREHGNYLLDRIFVNDTEPYDEIDLDLNE